MKKSVLMSGSSSAPVNGQCADTRSQVTPKRPNDRASNGSREWNLRRDLHQWVTSNYLLGILILLMLIIGWARPAFWSSGNLNNVLFQTAFVGISACGMTIMIAGGLIDLSVGGVIAVSSILLASILPSMTVGSAIMLALICGAVLGAVSGLIVTYLRIAPFIATLGTLYLFLGLAFIVTNAKVIPVTSSAYRSYTTSSLGILPIPFLVMLLLAGITYFLLHRTYFGRTVRAFGSNERAARLAGLRVNRTKILVFVFAGVCFALTGVFMAGRLSSAEGNMATGFEMDVIAAVVLGGTPLRGGRGTVFGTMVGSAMFAVIANSMNLLGIASYWQYVLTGGILAIAVALGIWKNKSDVIRGEG
jgi:ribose transport system permease protein